MLRIDRVQAGYGSVRVLNDIALHLGEREILVLLGRNGVGKSTLMRVLIGLLKPNHGRIEFDGTNITAAAPHRIAQRGIGFVPQGRGIFPKLTVRENLLIGTRARTDGSAEIPPEIFDYFPILAQRLNQAGGTLSGGEQQMLAIGRALAGGPKLLLLDEPSEGIQPNIVHQIGMLVRRIVTEAGLSVLLVEQNLDLGLTVADRCAIMEKGAIVREGTPAEFQDEATLSEYLAI